MKTERNILIAFLLNLLFSIFEFFGGIFTGSVAIVSDAIHDLGDATSIGVSYFLEKKSKKEPDERHTYGYARYSVMGSVITTLILLVGSFAVIYNAVLRIINPTQINYDGMIVFALFGVIINFSAAFFTRGGHSLNQRAVNLHMLEDVLGWAVVLIGAIIMRFTDFSLLDAILSIGVAIFILLNSFNNLKEALDLFLEKTPKDVEVSKIKNVILDIDGVIDVHHIHLWSLNGEDIFATMHIVTNREGHFIKNEIKKMLLNHGISHVTLELETENEDCHSEECIVESHIHDCEHHHHHHHHHH